MSYIISFSVIVNSMPRDRVAKPNLKVQLNNSFQL